MAHRPATGNRPAPARGHGRGGAATGGSDDTIGGRSGGAARRDADAARRRSGSAAARDTRVRLIEEAERLFAVRGFAGVSLREIGAAAGARNNSAAQYHFGDRQGLVNAVFDHRMASINERRLALLAEHGTGPDGIVDPNGAGATNDPAADTNGSAGIDLAGSSETVVMSDTAATGARAALVGSRVVDTATAERVRALVTAMVVPLAETYDPAPHSTYYCRFSAQVMADPVLVRSLASLDRPVMTGLRDVYAHLGALLAAPGDGHAGLPGAVATQRLGLAATLFVRALADHEADRDAGVPPARHPFSSFVDGLVDAITGLLLAPSRERVALLPP